MKFDEETLIAIEDYINELDESVGLDSATLIDIDKAIAKKRKELKNLTTQRVLKVEHSGTTVCCDTCAHIKNFTQETPCDTCFVNCENWEQQTGS